MCTNINTVINRDHIVNCTRKLQKLLYSCGKRVMLTLTSGGRNLFFTEIEIL